MPWPSHVLPVTREGAPDPADAPADRLVAGSGVSQVWNAFSDASGRFHVGHWESEPGVRRVAYDETEFCLLLKGRVRLEGPDGAVEFGPGEPFVIQGGFSGTWESIGEVVKLYVILEP